MKVLDAAWETPDVYRIRVQRSAGFAFEPGQFCNIGLDVDGGTQVHAYSIASSRQAEHLEFATKQTPSDYTDTFCKLAPGDAIDLDGPFGRFVAREQDDPMVMLCGGIGITPLRSLAATAAEEEWGRQITLVYSNHAAQDIAFRHDLDRLDGHDDIRVVHTLTGVAKSDVPEGFERGHIDAPMLQRLGLLDGQAAYFVCGPPAMVDELAAMLAKKGIPDTRIRQERFTGYEGNA